jgi:hypothetical protein
MPLASTTVIRQNAWAYGMLYRKENKTRYSRKRQLQNSINGVTPGKAGVQKFLERLDTGFPRNDKLGLLQSAQVKKITPFKLIISPAQGENIILLTRGEMISLNGLRFFRWQSFHPSDDVMNGLRFFRQ